MTPDVFTKAYENGLRRTIAFLRSRGVRKDLAPDLAQGAWVRGWERLHDLRNDSAVISWVNAIAWNYFRQSLVSCEREVPLTEEYARITTLPSTKLDVEAVLRVAGKGDRDLFTAQILGHTNREIAHQLGVTETVVRVRICRAKQAARAALRIEKLPVAA